MQSWRKKSILRFFIAYLTCFAMMVEIAQAGKDRMPNDVVIDVPDDKTKRTWNILIHSIALVIYAGFLIWVIYNIV